MRSSSTTQLLDVRDQTWALLDRAGLPRRIFPPLRRPGDLVGELLPEVAAGAGLAAGLPVIARAAPDDRAGLRALVRASSRLRYFQPGGRAGQWQAAARRLG